MRKITTESGSVYEYDAPNSRFRRQSKFTLRGDEDWVTIVNKPVLKIGLPVSFMCIGLSDLGPDSYGNEVGPGATTIRTTTPIVRIDIV
jgi:hypothetical protein